VPVRDIAGRRYALAILEIAKPSGTLDHWREALDSLEGLTARSHYVEALQADGMTDERFQGIVRQVIPDVSPVEMNLFRLLRRKSRLSLGPSIASYYRELLDVERGVGRATVRTAVELTEEQARALRERLSQQTGQTIELETEVDPSMIGGAVIRIGDQMLDGSTRRRLLNLREQLIRAGT
jgi:F-type H+-transporting ATPase subunit delta